MKHWIYCAAIMACIGCGETVVDHSRDPERFAAGVKELVMVTIEDAKISREPADVLEGLVREVSPEDLQYRPTGSYLDIYQELHAVALRLYEAADAAGGRPSGLQNDLDELAKIAERLPGEIREYSFED